MDHLILPFGIELTEEDEIPYVSSNDYLGVPFLEYVKTNEAYQVAPTEEGAWVTYKSKLETPDLERFLQTWLFFGLLQEMLGTTFDPQDFVRAAGSKVVISTRNLLWKVEQWISDSDFDQERLTHLHHCLRMTQIALIATPVQFDRKLKVGIATTAEVVTTSILLAATSRNISTEIFPALPWGDLDESSLRVAEMVSRHGWCPAQASWALGKFWSLQAKIYLSQITKPSKKGAHDACSFEDCRALQIDPLTYKSLHRHPGTCDDIEANQVEVVKALKDDKNALLDLILNETSNEVSVEIRAAQPNSWYIALSHVWADGLGNTKENSLPRCQLRHLYDLLTRFSKEEHTGGGQKRPYLWLDTLCCPVDPKNKLLALAKMPEVYKEASQVLILDSSLTEIDCSHLQPIEVLSRVFTSGWIFRVWTVNEANLASKLWVQFRDRVIELGKTRNSLFIMKRPETYHFTAVLYNEYEKLQFQHLKTAAGELWYITEALRYRNVSETSDEPICIAALLQMEVGVITGEEKVLLSSNHNDKIRVRDERMARIWERCAQGHPRIPKTLIYHVGDRLTRHGLRWAPSTLLHIENTAKFCCLPKMDLALPSADGLILSSVAYSISVPERVDSILSRPSAVASSTFDLLKYDEHHWFRLMSTSEQKKSPPDCSDMALYDIITEAGKGTEFDILIERPVNLSEESSTSINCLLVENAKKESENPKPGMRNVRFVRQAQISIIDRDVCDFLNLLLEKAQALQNDSITEEIRENSKHGAENERYRDIMKRLLEKVWSLVGQLEEELNAKGKDLLDSGLGLVYDRPKAIFALLSRFYRNRYLVKEGDFPATQEYCLD